VQGEDCPRIAIFPDIPDIPDMQDLGGGFAFQPRAFQASHYGQGVEKSILLWHDRHSRMTVIPKQEKAACRVVPLVLVALVLLTFHRPILARVRVNGGDVVSFCTFSFTDQPIGLSLCHLPVLHYQTMP
jgi:hypothetical protein